MSPSDAFVAADQKNIDESPSIVGRALGRGAHRCDLRPFAIPTATHATTKPERVGTVVQAVVIVQDATDDRELSLVDAWSVGVAPPVG
jgi:hypothetical protein